VLAQQLEELFQGDRLGDGKDRGPRGHHLAHQLVAELDRRAHQVAVALFEDSLLFTGFEQRLDIDGGLLLGTGLLLGQRGQREEEADKNGDGRHQPEQQEDGPENARHPAATGAVEEQRGQNPIAEDHHQHHGKNRLGNLCGGGPNQQRGAIEEHRAELKCDQPQGKLLQNSGADLGVFAAQAQARLDLLLPCVQVFLLLARQNLAELAVDEADVGGQRLDQGQKNNQQDEERGHSLRPRFVSDAPAILGALSF
jgi:hypothetical protein